MTFAEFEARRAVLDRIAAEASAVLEGVAQSLAAELNLPRHGAMGLTPDAIKFAPRYRAAKLALDAAVAAARAFNGRYAGRFKKEIRAAIDAWRLAKLQS